MGFRKPTVRSDAFSASWLSAVVNRLASLEFTCARPSLCASITASGSIHNPPRGLTSMMFRRALALIAVVVMPAVVAAQADKPEGIALAPVVKAVNDALVDAQSKNVKG